MSTAKSLDADTLLSAILSGGVIGGSVAILDQNMERSKFAIPIGMALGILLDYQLKKRRGSEQIEIAKGYFQSLWDLVESEPMGDRVPYNAYWSALTTGLVSLATVGLTSAGAIGSIGQFFTAAVVPQRLLQPPLDNALPQAGPLPPRR